MNNEFDVIYKVAVLMKKEEILSDFGFRILHNEIIEDIQTLKKDEQQKLVRICLYLTIVYNMTILFGGWIEDDKENRKEYSDDFEVLKKLSLDFYKSLPIYLKGLNDYYLEKYHETKTGIFVKNIFENIQHLPTHPNEQKYIDIINNSREA